MFIMPDPKGPVQKGPLLAGKRKDSDGRRVYQESVNPTGKTGHDFATTLGHFMP
jgi:hypothetical protein